MNMRNLLEQAAADEARRETVLYWCKIISAVSQALICAAILGYVYGMLNL